MKATGERLMVALREWYTWPGDTFYSRESKIFSSATVPDAHPDTWGYPAAHASDSEDDDPSHWTNLLVSFDEDGGIAS